MLRKAGEGGHKTLPPLYAGRDKDGRMVFSEELDVPRNPVVLRALNQARKVLNALVRRYGSPVAVHIEMARDLSRPLQGHWTDNGKYIEGRRDVQKAQDEYRERNEKDKAAFEAEFNMQAKSREFEKFQLYREQQGKCAYSLEPLDLHRVLHDIGYADVAAPVLAVRLQEVFGLTETPRVGEGRVPITIHLLSPARRPVQVTRDLASFWANGYKAVKSELKGRYPRHYWPDDPLVAEPTARARPRPR